MEQTRGWVYKMVDPDTGASRYVGETTRPLMQRLGRHIQGAVTMPRNVAEWIRGLLERGRVPLMIELEEVSGTKHDRLAAEDRWIEKLRAEGHDLLNRPKGAIDPEKIAVASRRVWAGHSEERRKLRCQNISRALKGKKYGPQSPDLVTKRTEALNRSLAARIGPMVQAILAAADGATEAELAIRTGIKEMTLGNWLYRLKAEGRLRTERHGREPNRWFAV